jgi:streptogramin lyase
VPIALAAADGFVWTATIDGPTLVRIDPATGKTDTFSLGSGRLQFGPAIAYVAGSLWVIAPPHVVRFDPATGTVVATVDAGSDVYDLAAATDRVWFSRPNTGTVSTIVARTNRIGRAFPVPAEPKELLVGGTTVWVASHYGAIRELEAKSGRVLATVGDMNQPRNMALRTGSLWVADLRGRIVRVDAEAAAIDTAIEVAAEPFGILATDRAILAAGAARGGGGVVIDVDPDGGQPRGEKSLGVAHLGELLCADGALWVTDIDGGNVIEVEEPGCS